MNDIITNIIPVESKKTLKELIDFPTDFMFKIIGKSETINILNIINKIEGILKEKVSENSMSKKESSKKKYSSYTIKVYLKDYEQLSQIYEMLKNDETVIHYF